jgi:proteic killer suppression protein
MNVRFANADLDRLETDPKFTGGYSQAVVKSYRKKLQAIRAAADERDIRALRSWHLEQLKGDRKGQSSIRLNDQFRLVIVFETDQSGRTVVVIEIVDYH